MVKVLEGLKLVNPQLTIPKPIGVGIVVGGVFLRRLAVLEGLNYTISLIYWIVWIPAYFKKLINFKLSNLRFAT